MAYYCNGKKDICQDNNCNTCGYYDGTGGYDTIDLCCQNCKKPIENKEYKFCPYCGAKIN